MLDAWSADPEWKNLVGHLVQRDHYLHDIFAFAAGDVLRRYGNQVRITAAPIGPLGPLAHPDLDLAVIGSSSFAVEVKAPASMRAPTPENLTLADATTRIVQYASAAVRQVGGRSAILALGGLRYPKRNLRLLAQAVPDSMPAPFVGVMVLSLGLAEEDMQEEIPANPRASVWVRLAANLNPTTLLGAIPSQMICVPTYRGPRPRGFVPRK